MAVPEEATVSAVSKLRFSCMVFGLLLFSSSLKADQVLLDVSDDTSLPWGALRGDIFKVGYSGFNQTNVLFSTSDSSYTGQPYKVVNSGFYYSAMGWTDVYTVLGLDQNPVSGAYLAITMGQDGNVSFSATVDPSAVWNFMQNGFQSSASTSWTNVANTLFPPPPPAPVFTPPPPPAPVFTPPPAPPAPAIPVVTFIPWVIVKPDTGFLSQPFVDIQDSPEPATGVLLLTGAVALWLWRRKQAKP